MDEDIKNLLITWGLEGYIEIFATNKITLNTLNLLDQNMIKELFPPIADRAIFTKNLENYFLSLSVEAEQLKEKPNETTTIFEDVDMLSPKHKDPFSNATNMEMFQTENDYRSNILSSALPSTSMSSCIVLPQIKEDIQKQKKLLHILESSIDGKSILSLHREDGLLSSSSRRKLCNIIIKDLLGDDPNNKNISSATLFDMASQIKEIFQKENISTYYIPYINNKKLKIKRCAKGKLYDCLHNRRREYRLAEKKIKTCDNGSTYPENEDTIDITMDVSDDDMAWIKVSTEPWKLLEEKWKNTSKFRREEAKNMPISKYMAQYPGLKKPTGYHLLCIDFDIMYPEAKDNLFKNFMLFKKCILKLAISKCKSNSSMIATVKPMIDYLEESQLKNVEEVENITAFWVLSILAGQPLIKKQKKNCWRPSKQESKDGFIAHVSRHMDIQETITKRKEKYLTYGVTMQPSIFIVGKNLDTIEHYFVLVDDIFYSAHNIVEAVDICFKLIQALHCQYTFECETVWHFIQRGFYKIKTLYDKEFVSVNSLIADLHLSDI